MVSHTQTFPFQLPELPAGKKVTIYYNVVVNDPLDPVTTSTIGEHDTVFYGPGIFLLSNDPATVAPDDITLTPAAQFPCNSFSGVVYVDSSATDGNNDGTPVDANLARSINGQVYSNASTNPIPMAGEAIGYSGGSQTHNNMQPFLTLNYIIALVGLYPSRS